MTDIDDYKSYKVTQDNIINMELAIMGICLMMGGIFKELIMEKEKENPDLDRIKLLQADFSAYSHERDQIYSGNKDIIKKVLEVYAPIIKNRY